MSTASNYPLNIAPLVPYLEALLSGDVDWFSMESEDNPANTNEQWIRHLSENPDKWNVYHGQQDVICEIFKLDAVLQRVYEDSGLDEAVLKNDFNNFFGCSLGNDVDSVLSISGLLNKHYCIQAEVLTHVPPTLSLMPVIEMFKIAVVSDTAVTDLMGFKDPNEENLGVEDGLNYQVRLVTNVGPISIFDLADQERENSENGKIGALLEVFLEVFYRYTVEPTVHLVADKAPDEPIAELTEFIYDLMEDSLTHLEIH